MPGILLKGIFDFVEKKLSLERREPKRVNKNEPRHDKTNKMSMRSAKTQILRCALNG